MESNRDFEKEREEKRERERTSHIHRQSRETDIELFLDLDRYSPLESDLPIHFFSHMLDALTLQAEISLSIHGQGDIEVDDHHLIEDLGIVLGKAFRQALGDRAGIARYGSSRVVMDEALAQVDLDFSGRPYLVFEGEFKADKIGDFSSQMVEEFLRAFSNHAGLTLHVSIVHGKNDHHKVEALFKALGQAIGQAIEVGRAGLRSTKGMLE